jgi:branched-chain amino acid transport system permease protein
MRNTRIMILGACLIALILPIFVRDRLSLNILIMCYHYAYLALCWNLVGGYAGVLSLGHGIFFGIGAYTNVVLFKYLAVTPWLGMIVGGVFASIIALLIGSVAFSFGLAGFFFIVVTLALTQISEQVVKQFKFLGESEGMSLPLSEGWYSFQFTGKVEYYFIIVFLLIALIYISYLIKRSKLGYSLMAIREDEDTAEASGVDSRKCKNIIFTLSAFLTAIGGAFYVQYVFFVDPESMFSTTLNINLILAVVLGGIGTIWGPILGGFFYVLVSELLRFLPMESQLTAAVSRMVFSLILMIVIIYLPKGILNLSFSKSRGK